MEVRQLQLEILEAERFIERNKIILDINEQLTQAKAKISEIEAQKVE